MAGERLEFDIYARDSASSSFRSAAAAAADMGGKMDLAAKNAYILQEALNKQRKAADTSVGATLSLAKADKILADAEGVLSGRTIEAELALKREAEAAKKSGKAAVEAAAENGILASSMQKVADSSFLAGSGKGSFLALLPALIPVAGVAAGAIGAVGASFGAAAIAAGGFGIAAKSVLASASSDSDKLLTVQTSRASKLSQLQIQLGAATTKAQKKQIESQIATVKKASDLQTATIKAGWTQSYSNVVDSLTKIKATWKDTSRSVASPVLLPWLDAVNAGMGFLKPLIGPVATEFQTWGQAIDRYFKSKAGSTEIHSMAVSFGQFASLQLADIVSFIRDVGSGIHALGHDLSADGVYFGAFGDYLARWGSEFAAWSKSSKARGDVQGFLGFMHKNGALIVGVVKDLGKVLPGIFQGVSATGQLELQAVAGFLGFIAGLPPGWQKPLTEAAGALLLLSKTGVISTGLKLTFPKEGAGKGALAASLGMKLIGGALIVPAAVMIIGTIIPKDTSKQAAKDFANQPGIVVKVSNFLHVQGMGAWVDQYFSHPIRKWALTTLPDTLDTAASKVGVFLTKTIPTDALKMALSITGTFGKLPGPLGAPFRKAHADIADQLAAIQFKASHTFSAIQAGINAFHGKKVALTFGLNLPPGVSYPSRPIKGRAAGGPVYGPGTTTSDSAALVALSNKEYVVRASSHERYGTRAMDAVNKGTATVVYRAAGGIAGPAFAGTFPSASMIRGDDTAMQRAVNSIAAAVKGLLHINRSAFTFASAGGPASYGVTRWAPLILRVLAMLGQSSANLGPVEHRMQQESGGNPFAINLTDSNAAAGDPSRGLMQTIGSTFARYRSWALPNNIYNPEANIFAGLNYALHAYAGRSLSSVMLQPGGYDNGGWLQPGATLAINKTGRPEQVIPPGGGELAGLLEELIGEHQETNARLRVLAQQIGGALGDTLNGAARSSAYSSMYGSR